MSVTKTFNGKPYQFAGTGSQISWESLLPELERIFHIKLDEKIIGLEADQFGIHIRIERLNA